VRRFLVLLAITATVWVLVAQVRRGFELPTRHGEGMAQFLGLPANPVALYTFGPDPRLVPGAWWFLVGRNLLLWPEDLTNAKWVKYGLSDVSAVSDGFRITADGTQAWTRLYQQISASLEPGKHYCLSVEIRKGNTQYAGLDIIDGDGGTVISRITFSFDLNGTPTVDTQTGGTGSVLGATSGGYYRVTACGSSSTGGTSGYARFIPGKQGITPTNGDYLDLRYPQLEVGTSPTAYQKTEAQQTFHDFSGNGNTASRGSDDEAEDTNDPELTPSSRNLLAPGSTEDLTDSNWTAVDATVSADTALAPDGTSTADKLTASANNGHVYQTWTDEQGVAYVLSVYAKASTSTSFKLSWVDQGDAARYVLCDLASETVTAYGGATAESIVAVGDGWYRCSFSGASSGTDTNDLFRVELVNSGDSVYFWGVQLETGSTATAYTNPAEESVVQGIECDGVDDYVALPDESALKPDAFTVVAVLRMHDATDGEPVISWSATDSRPAVYARSPDDWGNQSKPLIYLNNENYCYFAETIETETWHVLAVTVPGSGQTDIEEAAFYLDGTPLTIDTVYSADSQMSKGQPWLGRAGDYYGHMDQALVGIYSRTISAAEIQRSYRSIARLYWDYRGICVSGWESHCQSPPLHARLLAPWQPDGTWVLAMLPRKLGLVPVWREVHDFSR